MDNVVDIQVTDEKIILKVPHKNIVTEIDNVATFDSATKKLLHFGLTPSTYQALYPRKWEKQKDKMEFIPIFSKGTLSPEAGAMLFWDWWSQVSRSVISPYIVFKHQVILEINLFVENYEAISQEQRGEFEYLLFRYLYVSKLSVNGNEKQLEQKNFQPEALHSWMTLIISICFVFLIPPLVSLGVFLLSSVSFSPLFTFLLSVIVFLGIAIPVIYLGRSLVSLLWLLILKPFFGRKTFLFALSYPGSNPQKHKISKTERVLINWIFPENNSL